MWRLTELATGGSKLPLRTSNHHSLTKALLYAQEHRIQDLGHRPTTSTEVEVGQRTAIEAEDELLVPSGPASHVPGPPTDPGTPPELALDPASALGAHSSKGPQIDSGDPLPRPCEVATPVERVWGPLGRTGEKAEVRDFAGRDLDGLPTRTMRARPEGPLVKGQEPSAMEDTCQRTRWTSPPPGGRARTRTRARSEGNTQWEETRGLCEASNCSWLSPRPGTRHPKEGESPGWTPPASGGQRHRQKLRPAKLQGGD